MKIDKIVPNGKTRSKVLFDGGLVLLLYNGEIGRMHFAEGTEYSDDEYRSKLIPILTKRAKEQVVFILKSSDKSENEVRRKLKEKYFPEESIEAAVEWAKSKHYIDDERYAETYLRYHSEGKSKKKIIYDLTNKGLDRNLIKNMLDSTEIDEDEQVASELKKRGYSPDMDMKEKQKIIAALTRKGYSWAVISAHVSEY